MSYVNTIQLMLKQNRFEKQTQAYGCNVSVREAVYLSHPDVSKSEMQPVTPTKVSIGPVYLNNRKFHNIVIKTFKDKIITYS